MLLASQRTISPSSVPTIRKRQTIMVHLAFASVATALLVGTSPAAGFVSLSARAAISTTPPLNVLKAATLGDDISFDIKRARECAESFGECSIEDMERMKNALHAERIANFLSAKSDPSWPEAELQDRILEEDLDLQLKSLKAYIDDPRVEELEMPGQQRAEKLHTDMELMDHPLSVPTTDDVYGATPAAQHTASPWLEELAENAMSSDALVGKSDKAMSPDVFIRNSESFALLATMMIIMLLPEVVHHGMK